MTGQQASVAALAPHPGTYALVCRCSCRDEIAVGRLGFLAMRKGFYVYIGSAFGPGGIRARVARHVSRPVSRHWHIDYLWRSVRVAEVWYSHDPVRREHDWARILRRAEGSSVPLRQFGASDCRCEAHLLFFEQAPSLAWFRAQRAQRVAVAIPGQIQTSTTAQLTRA